MITDWTRFEEMCKDVNTDNDVNAVINYLIQNGYGELDAREMVQFQLYHQAGEEAPI